MAAIHYLSELDKIKASKAYQPIILDMGIEALQIALLMIVNGMDIDYVFDCLQGFDPSNPDP